MEWAGCLPVVLFALLILDSITKLYVYCKRCSSESCGARVGLVPVVPGLFQFFVYLWSGFGGQERGARRSKLLFLLDRYIHKEEEEILWVFVCAVVPEN